MISLWIMQKRRHARLAAQRKGDTVSNETISESNVAVARAEADVESVALELQLLKKEQPLKLHRLEVAWSRNKLNIMAAIHDLQERIENLEYDLKTHEADTAHEDNKLKRIKEELQSAILVAKSDGIVRHHQTSYGGVRNWVEAGDRVKERQVILEISRRRAFAGTSARRQERDPSNKGGPASENDAFVQSGLFRLPRHCKGHRPFASAGLKGYTGL